MRPLALLLALAAGCASAPAAPAPPAASPAAPPPGAEPPLADPAEYRIEHVSRAAGEAIFARTGIGDPYRTGIPYPVFLALLRAYPEALGADAQALARRFGFVERAPAAGSDDLDLREGLPLGLHLTIDPETHVPFVMTNCALCHAERVRWPGGERLVLGLGSRRVRAHDYEAALADVARRPDFDQARLGPLADEQAEAHQIAWTSRWRDVVLRASLAAMKTRAEARSAYLARVRGGPPGRVATIEAFAVALSALTGQPVPTPPAVGWARVPDVIGFAHRTTLSWDGAGEGSMDVLVVEADLAVGARPAWFWSHPFQGPSLSMFLRSLRRDLPFPAPVDRPLAARGKASFERACSRCHGTYADDGRPLSYTEALIPLAIIGTDPARSDAKSEAFVRAANDPALTHRITVTRPTRGYVPPVLTHLWTRAPYGHSGQWASLAALAQRPAERAVRQVVDLEGPLDLERVGLRSRPAGGAPPGPGEFLQDASAPGLSVGGHPFLSDLEPEERRAVVEYLKTLLFGVGRGSEARAGGGARGVVVGPPRPPLGRSRAAAGRGGSRTNLALR